MKKISFNMQLDIKSYWRAGSGASAGAYADLLVIKKQGLPYLPGKQLKGILRQAFETANKAAWLDDDNSQGGDIVKQLFGEEGANGQGLIEISNAQISEPERHWFQEDEERIKMLYHTKDTQAVNHETGTTIQHSLRTMEVTVPIKLYAVIGLRNDVLAEVDDSTIDRFKKGLEDCCSLITVIGADRNRGLGRVIVTVEKTL